MRDREKANARQRRYNAVHPERIAELNRRYRETHPDYHREHMAEYRPGYLAGLKSAVFGHYGWECACCGATDRLCIDHIDGNGREHRQELFGRQAGTDQAMYLWLIRNEFPAGFQTMCRSCNSSKGNGDRCRMHHLERV